VPAKRIVVAIVAGFVLVGAGRYLIHSVWLASAYAQDSGLWRTQAAMLHRVWVVQLAGFLFAAAATLIYVRGIEAKPWFGQGVRFGILLAFATAIPQSMVEYFTYPIPHTMMIQWIIGEGGLALLLGILVSAICRPTAAPAPGRLR